MVTKKRNFGDFGETIALKFLMKHGFTIVERNYLRPWGEIDLIAKRVDGYHFIEVKSSKVSFESVVVTHETVRPEDNIHLAKLRRVQKAVMTFCMENSIDEDAVSIDAVIVRISPDYKKAKVLFMDNIVL
jgi:putative endonuclease